MIVISATNGAGSSSPAAIMLTYSTTDNSRNVIHDLIGGGIAVALVAPRPRSGTLTLIYPDSDSAYAARALHRQASSFALSGAEPADIDMTYVLDGALTVSLATSGWSVAVAFQEVT